MADFLTLDDLPADLRGKRALVRVDFNLPMEDGRVSDDTRVHAALPTINELAERGARIVLLAHFGRPKGRRDESQSLRPVLPALTAALGREARFASDCIGPEIEKTVAGLSDGQVLLVENLRFHPGEEKNDPQFAAEIARLGDFYVNDAFSVAHRANVSTEALAHIMPAYAGRAMEKELDALEKALSRPEHPVVAVVGGAKVSTKIDLLANLVKKVDVLIIGGGMANTFLAADDHPVGKSLHEADLLDTAREIEAAAQAAGCRLVLPVDTVVARELAAHADCRTAPLDGVARDEMILDAGPVSIKAIHEVLDEARTLVWNGPFGAFEFPPFDKATVAVARHAADLTKSGRLLSVAGGGDTVAALNHAGVVDSFSYVSTAGGAFLEWLEGKTLPAVEALRAKA